MKLENVHENINNISISSILFNAIENCIRYTNILFEDTKLIKEDLMKIDKRREKYKIVQVTLINFKVNVLLFIINRICIENILIKENIQKNRKIII